MKLLFDIGNSRLKYATLSEGKITSINAISHSAPSELSASLSAISQQPEALYFINVAACDTEERIISASKQLWGLVPNRLQVTTECAGVTNGYEDPTRLGVDRWAAMIGAYNLVGAAVLVIDCGTACTADLLNDAGLHLGGAIIPGESLMQSSLHLGTAHIELGADDVQEVGLGRTTEQCVNLGVREALSGFISNMRQKGTTLLGKEPTVVITGGTAPDLLPYSDTDVVYDEALVFSGMAVMALRSGE